MHVSSYVGTLSGQLNIKKDMEQDANGKDIIIVAETLIMYAEVNRQEKQEDGSYIIGIGAKKFTQDVLEYLFTHIAPEDAK